MQEGRAANILYNLISELTLPDGRLIIHEGRLILQAEQI